jgi:hypothetical protein
MGGMKHLLAFALLLLAAAPAFAVTPNDECRGVLDHLSALYEIRSLMMKSYTSDYDVERLIDRRLEALRDPLPEGGYRWVRWVRPAGEGPAEKKVHIVSAVEGSNRDSVEISSAYPYAIRVVVPRKRSLLNANNPVYVGKVRVDYTVDGRTRTKEEAINQWMNPDTSRTIDLGVIADRANVILDAATAARNRGEAVVEIHARQAVAQDDPANPSYTAIQALLRVRGDIEPDTVDSEIAALERGLFPGAETLPLLTIVQDLRRADELMRSKKPEDVEQGDKLLKDTLRRLR